MKWTKYFGFPLNADFSHQQNIVVGPDGGEYYVDVSMTTSNEFFFKDLDMKKLNEYMLLQNIPKEEQDTVISSIRRLRELSVINVVSLVLNNWESFLEKGYPVDTREFYEYLLSNSIQKDFWELGKESLRRIILHIEKLPITQKNQHVRERILDHIQGL